MKTFFFAVFFIIFGAASGYAQAKPMTAEQLKFRDGIQQFLKEEGYLPTIDTDDNSVNYKKEGNRYWILVEDSSPFYVEMHRAGLDPDGLIRKVALEACNHANYEKRCGKACFGKTSIAFTVEFYCSSVEEFRNIFYRSMQALDAVRNDMVDYYNDNKNK